MITRQQLDLLAAYQSPVFLVTSCYLNLDRGQMSVPQLKIQTKDLVRAAAQQLQSLASSSAQHESLRHDLEKIEAWVLEDGLLASQRAVAIFSCVGERFWQLYRLPRAVASSVTAAASPALGPLRSVLAAHRRFCLVSLDRSQARLFEVYMGGVVEHAPIRDTIPHHGREGGWGGRQERNWERQHNQALRQHFQRVAEVTFTLYKQQQFDCLLMGGAREVLGEFKGYLHPYLRERWLTDLPLLPAQASADLVLNETLACEDHLRLEQLEQLSREIRTRAHQGDHAVLGLEKTLGALTCGEAEVVLIQDGLCLPGFHCESCSWGATDREVCPHCGQTAVAVADLVPLLQQQALRSGCVLQQTSGSSDWLAAAGIGALLRY